MTTRPPPTPGSSPDARSDAWSSRSSGWVGSPYRQAGSASVRSWPRASAGDGPATRSSSSSTTGGPDARSPRGRAPRPRDRRPSWHGAASRSSASSAGGEVTYHGPGQLVAYPIVRLRDRGVLLRPFVRALEPAMADMAATYGVRGQRDRAIPGIWVDADVRPRPQARGARPPPGAGHHATTASP